MLDKVREIFYHDCSEADVAFATQRLRPQAVAALFTPVHLTQERFGRIPQSLHRMYRRSGIVH